MSDVPVPQNFDQGAAQADASAGKDIMLRALAAGGSAMAQQAAAAQQATAGATSAAVNSAYQNSMAGAGGAQLASQETAKVSRNNEPFVLANMLAGQSAGEYTKILSDASTRYGDEVSKAIPLVHEQTQRELNSYHARAQEAKSRRDVERELAQMQLQRSRMELERATKGDSLDDRRLNLAERELALKERQPPGSDLTQWQREEQIGKARMAALQGINGELTNSPRAKWAFDQIIGRASDRGTAESGLNAVLNAEHGGYKTIKGKGKSGRLNAQYLQGLLDRYYGAGL